MTKRIFTFWEPKEHMPGYIQLCLRTWKKFLPDYEIVVCDYHNLKDYLTRQEIRQFLYKKFPLQQQADALRTIILKKYGGIWLDADTILTSSYIFNKIKEAPCVMIGNERDLQLAFICAQKESQFIHKWADAVQDKVADYRRFSHLLFLKKLFKEKRRRLKNWDYLGNSIINSLRHVCGRDALFVIDKNEIGAFPEMIYATGNTFEELYRTFYFSVPQIPVSDVLAKTKGVILLHNSWTPLKYKNMSQKEFLNQNIMLAQLLKKVLEIDS